MLMRTAAIEPIENNTFKHDIDSETRIEIGDVEASGFEPCLDWIKWGESRMNVGLMDYGGTASQISQDRIQWQKGDVTALFYRKDRPFNVPAGNYYNPEKAFEFDIILARRPAENRIPLSIRTTDAALCFQPALSLADRWDYKLKVPRIIQPANVRDSIAVYHPAKMHGKYGTGKICHIPAPVITDSAGRRVLGRLEIVDDDRVDVVIPWDFWRLGSYPMIVDPTFGWESNGAQAIMVSDYIRAGVFTITEHGVGISLKAWMSADAESVFFFSKGHVLSGDGGTGYVTGADTVELSQPPGAATCRTYNFNGSPVFQKDQAYTLALWGNAYDGVEKGFLYQYIAYDTGISGAVAYYDEEAYGSWPVPPVWTPHAAGTRMSIFVDYDFPAVGMVSAAFSAALPEAAFSAARPGVAFAVA